MWHANAHSLTINTISIIATFTNHNNSNKCLQSISRFNYNKLCLCLLDGVFTSSSSQPSPTSTKLYTINSSVTTVAASVSVTVVMIVIISLVASTVFFAYKCKRKKGLNMR